MFVKLANGNVAVVGLWATQEETQEVEKLTGKSLTIDQQVAILSETEASNSLYKFLSDNPRFPLLRMLRQLVKEPTTPTRRHRIKK